MLTVGLIVTERSFDAITHQLAWRRATLACAGAVLLLLCVMRVRMRFDEGLLPGVGPSFVVVPALLLVWSWFRLACKCLGRVAEQQSSETPALPFLW